MADIIQVAAIEEIRGLRKGYGDIRLVRKTVSQINRVAEKERAKEQAALRMVRDGG